MTTKTNSPNASTSLLSEIPEHLQEYITEQDPALYTPEDHAAWRFIMRISKSFFKTYAHPMYLTGLQATGISSERIPLISEMDAALKKLGWRAVAINGFIPPSVFLEFQSLKILAIACDMRKIENLGYTPSPDIVHEAAGHAPIVADPSYRNYLEAYGQVARNAIISKQDLELYDAIYDLSEIKENPKATEQEINLAQNRFEDVAKKITEPSEASLLARMAWWTTEYGMVDVNGAPLIYGAGLLSSIAESFHTLDANVKKIPFTMKQAVATSYDITQPQPQLFVAKDFDSLTVALEEFANTMAYRKGGAYGLEVAKKAGATVTVVFDTHLQITGVVTDFETNAAGEVISFRIGGTKQVSYHDEAMTEISYGLFGSQIYFPLFDTSVTKTSMDDIQRKLHGSGLHTKAGHRISGHLKKEVRMGAAGKILILENVRVQDAAGKMVFEERTKPYPFVIGSQVVSVFGGAADRKEFALRHSNQKKKVKSHKTNRSEENEEINQLYAQIREIREKNNKDIPLLERIALDVQIQHPDAWLIQLELLELFLLWAPSSKSVVDLNSNLQVLSSKKPELEEHIQRGLALL